MNERNGFPVPFRVPNPVSRIQQDTCRKWGNDETPLEVASSRIPSLAPPVVSKKRGLPKLFLFSRPLPPNDWGGGVGKTETEKKEGWRVGQGGIGVKEKDWMEEVEWRGGEGRGWRE